MWVWLECRLHHVLLFRVSCLLFHEFWWVRTQTLVSNGCKRLLRRWYPFTVYSFEYLLSCRGYPAMSLFPRHSCKVLRKLQLFTRIWPNLVHTHREEAGGGGPHFCCCLLGRLVEGGGSSSSLGFPDKGLEGATRFIVGGYGVGVREGSHID